MYSLDWSSNSKWQKTNSFADTLEELLLLGHIPYDIEYMWSFLKIHHVKLYNAQWMSQ